ncbi:anthranilate phosphoribosyltransferase [Microbotryomycetes sp. JL221]|nr:anthranilate phosphoribosyltransferase [Microbotryomycetes sp. JL221]
MLSSRPHSGQATPRDVTRIIGLESEVQTPTTSPSESTISPYSPESFAPLLKRLVLHPNDFTADDARIAFNHIAEDKGTTPAQLGAFLSCLRLTGKDGQPSIVAACADVLQKHTIAVDVGEFGQGPICDIVGTGGDGHNTFNVSTTAAIVAAGAGCRVYKHGNKAATSSSGSADILMSLGCPVTSLPATSINQVASTSPFLFLYAPVYHPALVRMAPIRKQIAFPTVFNAIGPLINPARPKAMVVGVHSKFLGPIFIEALRITGVERAWVVCGAEGLDEISPAGDTHVWNLENDAITEMTVSPLDFGLALNSIESVAGGTPLENATTLELLLDNQLEPTNPIENFVMLNSAALLLVSGKAADFKEGVELARQSISSGNARKALNKFRHASQEALAEVERRQQRELD